MKLTTMEFLSRVEHKTDTECWRWKHGRNGDGYGIAWLPGGKSIKAHRLSYSLFCGPIPNNILVCHRCDNPICVNPSHLFLGTQKDNTQDAIRKGRRKDPPGTEINRHKKFCIRGHPLIQENIDLYNHQRRCRICKQIRRRKYYLEKKA